MLAGILLCGTTGCRNKQPQAPAESSNTSADLSGGNNESGFDIERVRKDYYYGLVNDPDKLSGRLNDPSLGVRFFPRMIPLNQSP